MVTQGQTSLQAAQAASQALALVAWAAQAASQALALVAWLAQVALVEARLALLLPLRYCPLCFLLQR